jgi:ligand-binding sensor domain-containing protein/signal transduction histidine kinase/DNA-binding response OmpR family regulator
LSAQHENFVFRHLTISDGLSQSSVIAIVQDKKGLMWFGTRDGLNRYDGREFTVFRNDKSDSSTISSNNLTSIIVDSNGDLWIGTFNGLNKYDYKKERFIQFFNNTEDSLTLSDNSVWTVFESKKGDIWVGTANGLNRWNKKNQKFTRYYHDEQNKNSLSSNYVQGIFEDSDGNIWVATARGLNRLTQGKNGSVQFKRYLHEPGNPTSISDSFTQTVAEDSDGNLWIGTKFGGLNRYVRTTDTFERYEHDPAYINSISNDDVRCLAFDNHGNFWVGTYSGLNLFDTERKYFHRLVNDKDNDNTLTKNSIKSLFMDRKGSLWIGTYYGGVNFLDRQNGNFKNYRYNSGSSELTYDVISSIIDDSNGNIYFGTEGGGVNILKNNSSEFEYILKDNTSISISSNNIKSLYLDEKENLWLGTYNGGLTILDRKSGMMSYYKNDPKDQNSLSDNDVYSIAQQNDSLFWLGTHGGGLSLFNSRSQKFTHFREGPETDLSSDFVRILYQDTKGNLWVGTQYGLNFLSAENIKNNEIKFRHYFYDQKKLTGEDILTIYEDSQARIWAGTNDSGLNLLDTTANRFENYDLAKISGTIGNVVHGILEDDHQNLWISTNQGILKLNPNDSTHKIFDETDGLVASEFNNNSCLKAHDGQMFFGSLQGVTRFHPDSIVTNRHVPPVVLTDLKLFGKSVKVGGSDGVLKKTISHTSHIELNYNQAIFTIAFAIPNYINPGKNHYAYRLSGLEEQWNITNSSSATYTIQQPGTYLFEVKGANNDGEWGAEPAILKVVVNPAPWKTWWAFLLYGMIISVALFLLLNIILSRSKFKHELELEHVNSERQKAINQMKLQFFTNISHEIRNPLVLILGPLEQIIANYKGSNSLYKQLLVIEKNAGRLLKLIDQLMDFRKFENKHYKLKAAEGNIVNFVKEIFLSFKPYARLHQFNYEFSSDSNAIKLWYDCDKMERVVVNLISNAFKYSTDSRNIKISVRQVKGYVEIAVADSGIGIDPAHLDKIFERFYEVGYNENHVHVKYSRGTGIGLALAKGIVDMHLGQIRVESKKNEGSTFTVRMPLGKDHLKEEQIIKDFKNSEDIKGYEVNAYLPYAPDEKFHFVDLTKDAPTVLIVEDNDEVRKYMVQIFRDSYNLREASSGKEGLNKALQFVPDIIISDAMMPDMDGIEFCSQIKNNIKTSHIPFILLTARTSLVFKFEGLEMGADDYISKPFNVKELRMKIKNLICTQKRLKEKFKSDSIVTPNEVTISSIDEKLLEKTLQIVDENMSNEMFDIPTFCEEVGMSRTMLFTKIKAWTNLTPNEFIQTMRLKRAAQLLEQNKLTIAQVGFKVGFRNPKYFSKCFQQHFGETPTQYMKKFIYQDESDIKQG